MGHLLSINIAVFSGNTLNMLDGNPLVVSDGLADYFEEMHQ
jgi:hypothetical protein